MNCPSCDSQVADGARVCPECGTAVQELAGKTADRRSPERAGEALLLPASEGSQDADRIETLLGRYVEQQFVGGTVPEPEELCWQSPELLAPLLQLIREYENLNRLLAPPDGLTESQTLLHYRIVEKLGEGGMGQVYLAEDTKLGRRVALKLLPSEMAANPERFERFRREARFVAGLNHPNIVTIFSVEEAEGLAFISMELVDGRTLDALITPGGCAAEEILEVAEPLADALAAAHEQGIIHRDLKPANVMIGRDRRLKVLDFGLAKLRQAPASGEPTGSLTVEGRILGTLPYMSPEQVQGLAVDSRTDLFSLGVILYELATGWRPFRGESTAELISTILRDTPTPVTEINPRLPGRLGQIVQRCLAKDPDERYQSAGELCRDLEELREEIPQGRTVVGRKGTGALLGRGRRGVRRLVGATLGASLTLAAVIAGILLLTGGPPREPPLSAEPARPSVAVLPFQNLSSDPEVDWLSTGLAEMLTTDLSQSPEIDVLAADRLARILHDLGAEGGLPTSVELTRELAGRAGVETMLQGSFVRVGDSLRINFTIEAAQDGRILTGDWVEGRLDTALFSMVDGISRTVRLGLEVPQRAELATSIEEITTSSLEAWRYFLEGMKLNRQSKDQEALPLLEKAVAIDPDFALALTNLGTVHRNLGHAGQARNYARRAVEHADRLPIQQRYFVEGDFYGSQWRTYGQAIEAYRHALELYPEVTSLRNRLAARYLFRERYEEAIQVYQENLDRGSTYAGNYVDIAFAHAAMGRFDTGHRILSNFVRRHPDDWYAQLGLGWHLTQWGRLEEAAAALRLADALRPGDARVHNGWWRLAILRQDWDGAAAEAGRMAAFTDPYARWRGLVCAARTQLYGGRLERALARFEEAARAYPEPEANTAASHCWTARLLLQVGEPARALAKAQQAQREAPGEWPELEGMFLAALAHQALGQPREADRLAAALGERAAAEPNAVEQRQLHHLAGRLALSRGDVASALEELTAAAALLPPRGIPIHDHALPDHVPLWFALGEAELAAGRLPAARDWFRRVAESGVEHIEHPVLYVRSFHHLGALHERLGEPAAAAAAYERCSRCWPDGDLGRRDPG